MKPRVYQSRNVKGLWLVEYGCDPSDPDLMGFMFDPGETAEAAWRHALMFAIVVGRVV